MRSFNLKKSKNIKIRSLKEEDKQWVIQFIKKEWDSAIIITKGNMHYIEKLPGIIAHKNENILGILIYKIAGSECEIISLNSLIENKGVGTALLKEIEQIAISNNCRRLFVITTNDNTEALRFYQMKGYHLIALYKDAVLKSRELKPEIPILGNNNIEIRDEIELEKPLYE